MSQQEYGALEPSNLVCFGMLVNLGFVSRVDQHQTARVPLHIHDNGQTLLSQDSSEFGVITDLTARLLAPLLREPSIILQCFVAPSLFPQLPFAAEISKSRSKAISNPSTRVPAPGFFVILYGKTALFEPIGEFVSKCGLFLENPWFCNRNVEYRNPHRLTIATPLWTQELDYHRLNSVVEAYGTSVWHNPIDLFTHRDDHIWAETAKPLGLKADLYQHQRQALTFLLAREKGWALDCLDYPDVWRKEISNGTAVYTDCFGQAQLGPPREFRGGLLTDAPGLGKTLNVLALIASKKADSQIAASSATRPITLLIVPKTLMQTWVDEIQKHLQPDFLRHCLYYGSKRADHLRNIHKYDLIITTYSVVQRDWKARLSGSNGHFLHSVTWSRIVLDEAHIIREPSKSFAQSVYALEGDCRWAVSGTPIQNHLRDLFSLFKFLRCYPFDDQRVFNKCISQAWKTKSDPESVKRLKHLINALSLRRPKDTIALPERREYNITLPLSKHERAHYEAVRDSVRQHLKNFGYRENQPSLLNVLQCVNELRLTCTLGPRTQYDLNLKQLQDSSRSLWSAKTAQELFNQLDNSGQAFCVNAGCGQDLSSSPIEEDPDRNQEPRLAEPSKLFCYTCFKDSSVEVTYFYPVCNHVPRCPSAYSCEPSECEDASLRGSKVPNQIPSKLQALFEDLSIVPEDIKSVVFSGWTRTFDILQPLLTDRGIRCVRLHGGLSERSRTNVLRVFRTNPEIRVLLATIGCGGVGLDLTVASRAYITEPQWNPMAESQALDRIHRLGQEREVVMTRYIMQDTWEEQVVELQKKKQELADLTLNGGLKGKEEITAARLSYLERLVG